MCIRCGVVGLLYSSVDNTIRFELGLNSALQVFMTRSPFLQRDAFERKIYIFIRLQGPVHSLLLLLLFCIIKYCISTLRFS
jgi:hypothetical protein